LRQADGVTFADGVAANRVARWTGATWSAMGGGMPNTVRAMTKLANGNVVVVGTLVGLGNVQTWDGAAWSGLGGGQHRLRAHAAAERRYPRVRPVRHAGPARGALERDHVERARQRREQHAASSSTTRWWRSSWTRSRTGSRSPARTRCS
jgi:hypothetical protein